VVFLLDALVSVQTLEDPWSVAEPETVPFVRAVLTVRLAIAEVLLRNTSLPVPTGDRGWGAKQRECYGKCGGRTACSRLFKLRI